MTDPKAKIEDAFLESLMDEAKEAFIKKHRLPADIFEREFSPELANHVNQHYFLPSIKTRYDSSGMVVKPGKCALKIDIKTPPGSKQDNIEDYIEQACNELEKVAVSREIKRISRIVSEKLYNFATKPPPEFVTDVDLKDLSIVVKWRVPVQASALWQYLADLNRAITVTVKISRLKGIQERSQRRPGLHHRRRSLKNNR